MNLTTLVEMVQKQFEVPGSLPQGQNARPGIPEWIPLDAIEPSDNNISRVGQGHRVTNVTRSEHIIIETDSPGLPLETYKKPDPQELIFHGTDALAFYLPFHFYRSWGIFIRSSGIAYLAECLKGSPLNQDDAIFVQAAFDVLYEHEYFHCMCEVASALGELAHQEQWYRNYFIDIDSAKIEEALCNAAPFKLAKFKPFRTNLRNFFINQPEGYRDYHRYLKTSIFQGAQRILAEAMRFPPIRPKRPPTPWPAELLWPSQKAKTRQSIPSRLIFDESIPWIRIVRPFPKYIGIRVKVHSNDHEPAHFHLFSPPDQEYGRYQWPGFDPVGSKDPSLEGKIRKNLLLYLERYGDKIHEKLERVFSKELPRLVKV